MKTQHNKHLIRTVTVAMMAALVLVSSYISIPIPTAVGNTRIHLGNVFCLLAGLLLGWRGGLAAGLGSFIFDLLNPLYIASAPFTLLFKGFMGTTCGAIAHAGHGEAKRTLRTIVAAVCGAALYVVLYVGKSGLEAVYVKGFQWNVALVDMGQKAMVSSINAVIAVAIAVPLFAALRKSLQAAKLWHLFE